LKSRRIKDPIMNLDFILKHHKMPFKLVIEVDKKKYKKNNKYKNTKFSTKKKRDHIETLIHNFITKYLFSSSLLSKRFTTP
jgi:hypothetical protein